MWGMFDNLNGAGLCVVALISLSQSKSGVGFLTYYLHWQDWPPLMPIEIAGAGKPIQI